MYDFPKLIELDEYTKFSEPTLQIVRPRDISVPHIKVASEALDYIKHVKPQPGKTIILVLAMTAGEYYGANKNGDLFNVGRVRAGNVIITPEEGLIPHHKSFESDAHVFQHHINKDPAKALGSVLKSFYNPNMHRVELLLVLDNERAAETVEKIERGEFPAVSMGTKIRFDVCSICGNKAPSRAQYCDHAKYQLGVFLPNGKQVGVWNPSPRFFDISIVRRPADRVAFMMKKVAESVPEIRSSAILGERIEFLQNKMADAKKMSVINKIIRGDTVAAKEDDGDLNIVKNYADQVAKPAAQAMPPLSNATIQEMLQYRPAAVLASLASMGIFLTTPEFIKFFIGKAAPGVQIPDKLLQRAVDTQQLVFEMLAQNPDLMEEVRNTDFLDLSTDNIDPELVEKFSPLLEKRSQQDDYMRHRLVKCALEPGQGNWDILEIVDPRTGERYRTTRRAVRDAREALPKAKLHTTLRSLLGGGALMSGAYKLFGARAPTAYMVRKYHQAATAPYPYISTTGEEVPVGTELAKVGMNLKGAIMQLTHDWSMAPASSKTASRGQFEPNLSTACFDTVADWLGKVICL